MKQNESLKDYQSKTVNHLKPKFRDKINDSNFLLPPRTASLYWYFQNTVWCMPL